MKLEKAHQYNTKTESSSSQSEQHLQINSLVFFTSKFGLKPFVKEVHEHVKLLSENTTTVHDINWMGSGKSKYKMKPFVKSENG